MALDYGSWGKLTAQMAGPFGGSGTTVKLAEITLLAADWKGAVSPYSQVAAVEGVSVNSIVDLQLSVEQVGTFYEKGIALSAENDGGVITVHAIGSKPTEDCTIQATIMEVVA